MSSTHFLHKYTPALAISLILLIQLLAGLWHIGDPFYDSRYHYDWGPPFWLNHARLINEVGHNLTAIYHE